MNSIINFYKPKGITSNKALTKIKRLLRVKSAGFIGTLDPLAEGVLPIFTQKMTKLIPLFQNTTKTYFATIKLGYSSNTYDEEGEIVDHQFKTIIPINKIQEALEQFKGKILQEPPMFSAIKIDGKRLYKLASQGQIIERKKRPVTIFKLDIVDYQFPYLKLSILCSQGTYIRSIAHEIGQILGSGALLNGLVRTAHGNYFFIQDTIVLDEMEKKLEEQHYNLINNLQYQFKHFHHLHFYENELPKEFFNGNMIEVNNITQGSVENLDAEAFLYASNKLFAYGQIIVNSQNRIFFQPKKLLV